MRKTEWFSAKTFDRNQNLGLDKKRIYGKMIGCQSDGIYLLSLKKQRKWAFSSVG